MLKLDEGEMQKLKNLAYDEGAIEALRKFFMNECMTFSDHKSMDMLAACRLALDYINAVFDKLERMKETGEERSAKRNIV